MAMDVPAGRTARVTSAGTRSPRAFTAILLDRVGPGEVPVRYSDAGIAAEFDATVAFWRASS